MLDDNLMDVEMALCAARDRLVSLEATACRGDVPRANKVARPHIADAARVLDAAISCVKEGRFWLRPIPRDDRLPPEAF